MGKCQDLLKGVILLHKVRAMKRGYSRALCNLISQLSFETDEVIWMGIKEERKNVHDFVYLLIHSK